MGQITTGIGLISGLDIAGIVDQLISIESRPVRLIQSRTNILQSQQAAFQNLNAQLLGLSTDAENLVNVSNFRATVASTTNDQVLTATSTPSATPGTYSFLVSRLVSSQQTLTRGFGDFDQTPLTGGTITFERGEARLDTQSNLDNFNGGAGVQRGLIRLTDRSGASTVVDLSRAVTVNDVLDQINNSIGVRVLATVNGDALTLTDLTGSVAGDLIVANLGTTATATSLGLAGNSGGTNTLNGTNINTVGRFSVLAVLNDNNGIRKHGNLDDFNITTAGGGTYNISIANTTNLGDVIDEIAQETAGNVTATISADGLGLILTDNTGGGASFVVSALNSSNAAADLGILGNDADANAQIGGTRLTGGINSKLISNLNGGSGITTPGTLSIQNRAGTVTNIDLSTASSVIDVINTINNAAAGVTASLNSAGNGLLLTDTSGGTGDIIIADVSGTSGADLNLVSTFSNTTTVDSSSLQFRYISESTLLDALGVGAGKFIITDSSGLSATVDLTQGDEKTLGDVIREINSRGIAVTASINATGDGILLTDTNAGAAISAIKVEESGSTVAQDLGILGSAASAGVNLDGSFETSVVITANTLIIATLLSTLNEGDGVDNTIGSDEFIIATQDGNTFNVDLDGVTTVADFIAAVTAATGGSVTASINAIETGFKLTDNTAGASVFSVTAVGTSTAAADLGILAIDSDSDGIIGGSTVVQITTLQDLATAINDAKVGVTATIINDGSPGDPYRLSLASKTAGSLGAFIFDDGGLGFNPVTLSEAQDAVVFFGGADPAKAVALTSSSNTLDGVIPGVNIDLKTASSEVVSVTINKDTSAVTATVQKFVDSFNTLMDNIRGLDSYDVETKQRGLLLGDGTLSQIQSTLFSAVINRSEDLTSAFTSLSQIGITIGSGAILEFDTAVFQTALIDDPDAVEALFTFKETETDSNGDIITTASGVGQSIVDLLDRLTDPEFGTVQSRIDAISTQVSNNKDRIEFLNELLEQRRTRLTAEFIAMEIALAKLQNQSGSLSTLASLAAQATATVR